MPISDAKRRANAKWDAANMQIVACKIRKDIAAEFKVAAKANGTTPNELLRIYIMSYLGKSDD